MADQPGMTPVVHTPQQTGMTASRTNESAGAMLAARAAKEVEARAIVARSNPRNEDNARQFVLKSCKRYSFAKTAMYSKPVGGKDITGLSIRFAEEFSRYWGNLDNSTLLLSEDDERRVFEVACTDLQTNNVFRMPVIVTKTVERKFTKKGDEVLKQRMNSKQELVYVIVADDDALLTKQAALIAKAQREVILKHAPSDLKEEAEEDIVTVVKAKVESDPDGQKKEILDAFFDVGVTAAQVADYLGHTLDVVNPAELFMLRKVYRGVKDGEATWADVMAQKGRNVDDAAAPVAAGKPSGMDALKTAVNTTAQATAAAPAAPVAADEAPPKATEPEPPTNRATQLMDDALADDQKLVARESKTPPKK
jgi:hypothetical protein